MQFHDDLNPKLWNNDNTLKSEVQDKLQDIANEFIEFLGLPIDAIVDIQLTGSSANYNYSRYSDIDLHVIVDYAKVSNDPTIVEQYLWAMKQLFNQSHDIKIYGIPVELYAENSEIPAVSNGVYSLMDQTWVKEPVKLEPTDNDSAVLAKFDTIRRQIEECDTAEDATILLAKIYTMRKAGLSDAGELSVENLAFKMLRNGGYIDQLRNLKARELDKSLSLERLEKAELHDALIYPSHTIETVVTFDPGADEIQKLLNKYKALRILLASDGTDDHLIGMPAAAGDHRTLALWLIDQGFTIYDTTMYHIALLNGIPTLTLDGGYMPNPDIVAYLTSEMVDYTADDFKQLDLLLAKLPANVNAEYVKTAKDLNTMEVL